MGLSAQASPLSRKRLVNRITPLPPRRRAATRKETVRRNAVLKQSAALKRRFAALFLHDLIAKTVVVDSDATKFLYDRSMHT